MFPGASQGPILRIALSREYVMLEQHRPAEGTPAHHPGLTWLSPNKCDEMLLVQKPDDKATEAPAHSFHYLKKLSIQSQSNLLFVPFKVTLYQDHTF